MNTLSLSFRRVFVVFSALVLVLLTTTIAFAQAGSSSLRGIVTGLQGRAVSGAQVTISNAQKNFTRTQNTNSDGAYIFTSIPPGTYRLDVEATGFKKASVSDLQALIDTPGTFDVQLEVGNISETVSVVAGVDAPINSSDATIGNTFESRRIIELPLNANNVVGLLSLQPGVTRSGYVNGGRADQSNITLDGVDVNEQQSGLDVVTSQAFSSVLRVLRDSTQEFRVTTTNPNADTGRSSGAQVSLATKSGTNDWHGSLFYFHRNTVTTANDFFNNADGRFTPSDALVQSGAAKVGDERVPRPPLLRNFFGGSVGGPIKHDKAFFFFAYEGLRESTSTPSVQLVPLANVAQGIIRYKHTNANFSDPTCPAGTPGGVVCLTPAQINQAYTNANGITPGINQPAWDLLKDIARRFPANDVSAAGDGVNTGGFRFNAPTPTTLDTYVLKFDFNLTDSQTLFVRGNYQEDNIGLAPILPGFQAPSIWYHPKGFAAGHSWTISNRTVNRFTYGLTRAAFTRQGDQTGNQFSFRFVFAPGLTSSLTRVTPVHNFVDDVTFVKGNHTLQFGGNVRLIENTRQSFGSAFDSLTTNPSGYAGSAAVLTSAGPDGAGSAIFPNVAGNSLTPLRNILSAVIGRFSQYTANF